MAVPPVLLTVTVVAVGRGELFSEAVTVMSVSAADSPTELGFSASVTAVGAGSSSVMVSVAVPAVSPVVELPVRMTVSSPSARLSGLGSKDSVAVPLVCPEGIVTMKSLTGGWSVPGVAVPPVLLTVTVVAVGRGELFREAVTAIAVAAALSPMAVGFRERVIAVGAGSSSVIVSVAVPAASPPAMPVRITVSSPSARVSPVGSKDSVAVPVSCSAGIVTMKMLIAG